MDSWSFAILLVVYRIKLGLALVTLFSGLAAPTRYRWIAWSLLLTAVGLWTFGNEPLELGPHIGVANWMTFSIYVSGMGLGAASGFLVKEWLKQRVWKQSPGTPPKDDQTG